MSGADDTGGNSAKRTRAEWEQAEGDDYEDYSKILSGEEVKQLIDGVYNDKAWLLNFLGNEKLPEGKKKVRDCVITFSKAILKISGAYLAKLAAENATHAGESAITRACKSIEQAAKALELSATSKLQSPIGSYANIASHSVPQQAQKVALARGKSFAVTDAKRVYIGPCEQVKDRFASSAVTRQALTAAIKPAQLKLSVRRLLHGPNCSVIIEGDESVNEAVFNNNAALAEAGLEVKQPRKLNPRIIVHDVPVSLSSDDIIRSIVDQNLPEAQYSDLKAVYLYPARDKKLRSCVLEVNPDHRNFLLAKKKICIEWSICRVNDHVTIAQCFNCNGFRHLASACKNRVCCALCAGVHPTKDCKTQDTLKCANCASANLGNVKHAANDKGNCPILRNKIERKILTINYGGN